MPSSEGRHRSLRGINLFMLLCLRALVQQKSVTAAAAILSISQPAMSQILGKLRKVLGDPILVRGSDAMLPTPRGIQLAEIAGQVLQLLEGNVWRSPQFNPQSSVQLFSIMASDYIQVTFLPPLLRELLTQSPLSSIRLVSPDLSRIRDELESSAIDLGVGFFADLAPTLHSTGLFRDRLCCAVPRDRFARKRTISLADYLAMEHVVFFAERHGSSTMERHTDHALSLHSGERRIALHAQNMNTMLVAVGSQGLVATLPSRLARGQRFPNVMFLPPPFAIPDIVLSMIWHERQHRDVTHMWLRGVARKAARAMAAFPKASLT